MAAGAVACRAKSSVGDPAVGLEPVERGADVLVEVDDGCCVRVRLATALPLVVEREHSPSGLNAVINLRRGHDEPITG